MSTSHPHTKDSATSLDPPPQFALVAPQLYRSSSHAFLSHTAHYRQLKLKSIILLGLELPGRPLKAWCEKQGVKLVALDSNAAGTPSWQPIPQEVIKDGIEHILQPSNLPCLVMDPSGIYETGMLVGCLRKVQRWTLSAILAEYASLAGSKTRPSNEQFIELFDTDLVVLPPPSERPFWFVGPVGEEVEQPPEEQLATPTIGAGAGGAFVTSPAQVTVAG